MYAPDDIALCMDEDTTEVVWGAYAGRAYFDQPGSAALGGVGVSNDYALTLGVAVLPGIKAGAEIAVGGVSYKVREVWPLDDAAMVRLTLRRA